MNARHREHKQAIRGFMQEHYTDERLAQLLAHAQSGRLYYMQCCCFIGIPTADHALRGGEAMCSVAEWPAEQLHYKAARLLSGAEEAEHGFYELPTASHQGRSGETGNAIRRRILIPMIRAEMKRRERARHLIAEPELIAAT